MAWADVLPFPMVCLQPEQGTEGGGVREPHTELYVHLVWATWDRLPMLTAELAPAVYACIQAECRELKVEVVEIGGLENHVHLLVRMHPAVSVATLAKQVKGASSHLVTHRLEHPDVFKS